MRVYDVEVLGVSIKDANISALLQSEQYNSFKEAMNVAHKERELANEKRLLVVERDLAKEASDTATSRLLLQQEVDKLKLASVLEIELLKATNAQDVERIKAANEKELADLRATQRLAEAEAAKIQLEAKTKLEEAGQNLEELTFEKKLDRSKRQVEFDVTRQQTQLDMEAAQAKLDIENKLSLIAAEAAALVQKATAVTPDMVAALQAFSDKDMVARVSESMAPMALLGGVSVVDVVSKMFAGTGLEDILGSVKKNLGDKLK